MRKSIALSAARDLLFRLGITPNYAGFEQAASAVQLCIEQPRRLELVTKWLYPDVAKECGTTGAAVERNIRTVSCVAWQENRPLLEALARRRLAGPLRSTQFLSILVAEVRHVMLSSNAALLSPHGLGETVALAGEDHDMGVVDEPVNEGSGKAVIAKDSIPLGKLQI